MVAEGEDEGGWIKSKRLKLDWNLEVEGANSRMTRASRLRSGDCYVPKHKIIY